MTSATNASTRKKAQERHDRDRLTDEIITRQLMSTRDGRRWVWLRLAEAYMFIGDEDLDPYRMAFAKGRRNTGLRLLADVQAFTPNEYIQMTSENTEVQLREAPTNDRSDDDTPGD